MDTRYTYGERLYRMSLRRSAAGKDVDCVSGRIQRESGGKAIEFRLWVEKGCARPIPLKIVYQAKGYVRLTFEAVAS